jgi:antagonist of KipI
MFTTVQDLGRWGFQSRGVPVSGALDWYSHRAANTLLGNGAAMATLEVTMIGPHLKFETDTTFAVTGAEFHLTLDDDRIEMNRVIQASSGAILKFGARIRGARAYIAVGGGIDVPDVLGSKSTHVLTAMGGHRGRALKAGDTIAVGTMTRGERVKNSGMRFPEPLPLAAGAKLRVVPADTQLFGQLATRRFQVSPRSDRMGFRLEGPSLPSAPGGEMLSIAVPTGAIQVPPTGNPILLMNDHATTGGYAIAATAITADLPLAGQLAPGDWVEFEACSMEMAAAELRRREAALGSA